MRIPEVYDARVWSDDHITTHGRWYTLLIVTDTVELKASLGNNNPSVNKLIQAISLYHAARYKDAIRICRDILSYETDKRILLETHFMLGTSIIKSDETDDDHFAARPHFNSALELALSAPEPMYEKAGAITCNMGHTLAINTRFHDAAIACWRRSVDYFTKAGISLPHPYYNMATHTLYREQVPIFLDSALAIIEMDKKDKPSLERAACLTFYGRHYWFYGQSGKSFHALSEALKEYITYYGKDHPALISAYLDMAWFCFYPDAPDLSLLYSQKALDLALRFLDADDEQIGNIYNAIGLSHMILGDHDKAIAYFNKRLGQNYKGEWGYFTMAVRTWNNIAICEIKKGNFDEAINLINKALGLSEFFLTPLNIDRYNTSELSRDQWLINLGMAYQQKGLYEQAIASYQVPLNIFIKEAGNCNTTVAGLYCEMALCYEKSGKASIAIEYYNKALESMHCEIVNHALLADFMRDWTILFAQAGKARSHYSIWEMEIERAELDSAELYFAKAIDQINEMQKNFRESGSRFRLSHILSEVQAIYEGALAIALEKHQFTEKSEHLSDAFVLAEKSKALLLLETIQGTHNYKAKSEEWIQRENELKKEMAGIKRQIFKSEQCDDPDEKEGIVALNNALFDLWRNYESLIHKPGPSSETSLNIEKVSVASLDQTRQHLWLSGNALIEYFEGYQHIYAFVVLPDTSYAVRIPRDFPMEEWVNTLRSGMYDYFVQRDHLDKGKSDLSKTSYEDAAYGLYQKLIAPLGALPEKLMIIPDGILGYIPFEVLLKKPINDEKSEEESFLISEHEISYNYSATLWLEMKNKEYSTHGLLAFAPEFQDSDARYASVSEVRSESLGPLMFNDDEVSGIQRMMNGKAVFGNDATADRFRAMAEDYNILHLSTHAKLNDENPDYSFLAFTGSEEEASDDRLYISELYHMDLPVDMVVLSACETGTGKLQKGEGILSFARAFSFAGAKSVITSLWKANDRSTCEIMTLFYKYLKAGQSKSEALRSAKLAYLAGHKGEELHPFYWATFIPIGDMAAIEVDGGWHWGWGIFILALVVFTYVLSLTVQRANVLRLGLLIFLLNPMFSSGQHNGKTTYGIRQKPEVYDIRIWSEFGLPIEDRTVMHFTLDSSDVVEEHSGQGETIAKVYKAIAHYDSGKYDACISLCQDILLGADEILKSKILFLFGTALITRDGTRDRHRAQGKLERALDIVLSREDVDWAFAGQIACNLAKSIATNTRRHSKAIEVLKRSISYFDKAGIKEPHPYYTMDCFFNYNPESDSISYLDTAFQIILEKKSTGYLDQLAECYTLSGWKNWMLGDFESSFEDYNKVLDLYLQAYGKHHPSLIYPFANIAWSYYYPNYPDLALLYAHKALDLALEFYAPDDHRTGTILGLTGLCRFMQGNHPEAIRCFEMRLDKIRHINDVWRYINTARTMNNIALCHIKMGHFDEAIKIIQESIVLSHTHLSAEVMGDDSFENGWNFNLGYAYQKSGRYDEAHECYNKVLRSWIPIGGTCKVMIAGVYNEKAMCYEKAGNYEQAIRYYNMALTSLYCENQNLEFLGNDANRDWTAIFVWSGKGRIFNDLWKTDKNKSDLDSALFAFKKAIDVIDVLQENFRKKRSKFRMADILSEVQAIYEGAIACLFEKYKYSGHRGYLEAAYALVEKSKAILLLEAIRETGADRFAAIPHHLQQEEAVLRKSFGELKRKIYKEELKGEIADQEKIKEWNNKLFDTWRAYELLTRQMEKDYPAVQPGKHTIETVPIETLQEEMLEDSMALVEYFEGYSGIFAFVILRDTFYTREIPVDFPLEEWVHEIRSGMYDFFIQRDHLEKTASQSLKTMYQKFAYGLYEKLIAPLGPLPERLMIVPDGILGYIPFEVLVHRPLSQGLYGAEDYLISTHEISYNYSATLWQEMKHKAYKTKGLLAFAPAFAGSGESYASVSEVRSEALGPLFYNDDEVSAIHNLVPGKVLYGDDATAERFRAMAEDFNILHLSTHAKLNDADPDYSFLAFSGSEAEGSNDRLYVSELYHMNLPVDMVVLSACETGTGKLRKGEGILSFARAFSSAGAKSVITSLWKANDRSTCEIMTLFYKHLKEGQSKSEALRSAKLAYLAGHKGEELHPFYWATFVPIGDMAAIEVEGGWHWGWGLVLVSLIVFAFVVVTYLLSLRDRRPICCP